MDRKGRTGSICKVITTAKREVISLKFTHKLNFLPKGRTRTSGEVIGTIKQGVTSLFSALVGAAGRAGVRNVYKDDIVNIALCKTSLLSKGGSEALIYTTRLQIELPSVDTCA